MENLTKAEIMALVKESNFETLEEYFATYADEVTDARKENLIRYQSFVEGAKNFLDQIIEKAKGDYEGGIINNSDIEYLINDQLARATAAVEYVKSSLIALKTQGIVSSEPGPMYPTGRYEE